jgi:hypothetical protein
MVKTVYAASLAVLLFAGLAANVFAQNVEITIERVNSRVYSGFRERIYIDGRSRLTLANGASGKISIPAGEHTIYAELYTLTTDSLRFDARPGAKFVVTPHALDNFVIEQQSSGSAATAAAVAPAAGAAATAADRMSQAFNTPPATPAPAVPLPAPAVPAPADNSVETTLVRAAAVLMDRIPAGSKIAIVYVTARDEEVAEYITGELEFIMVDRGFTLIDRSQLDRIRREQEFQMSGEVDDTQAVSIGKIAGANVILTGAVTGTGELRRLRLRALSTESGQVLAVASERY